MSIKDGAFQIKCAEQALLPHPIIFFIAATLE